MRRSSWSQAFGANSARGAPRTSTEARTQRESLAASARSAEENVATLEHLVSHGNTEARAELETARNEVARLWREAGEIAAQEIELLSQSGAPPYAIEAQVDEVRATSTDAAFLEGLGAAEARAEAFARTERAEEAAEQVARTMEEEGPAAAAAQLEALTVDVDPEEALAILEAAAPTVDRIVDELGSGAESADGGQFDLGPSERQVMFDRIVADLAAAASRAAEAPGGEAELTRIAGRVANAIQEEGIGRFDEALGNAILGGNVWDPASGPGASSSVFAVEVMRQLAAAGHTDEADDILQNVEASTERLNDRIESLTQDVEAHNADLAQLMQDWSGLMSEEEQAEAIEAFRASHPEYAELEALTGPAFTTINGLHELPPELASLGHADDVSERVDQFVERIPDALGLTESGQEALAKLLETSDETPNLLDRVAAVAAKMSKGAKYLEKFGSLLLTSTVTNALAASMANDLPAVDRALASLQRQAAIFGLGDDQLNDVATSLREAMTATTLDDAEDALMRLDVSLENLGEEGVFSRTTALGQTFRAAGVLLSAVGTTSAIQNAIEERSFESVVGALGAAAGTGTAGIQFVGNMSQNLRPLLTGTTATALRFAGNAAAVVQAGFTTIQAAQAFEDGDPARGALLAAQAAGSIAVLAGATGVGAVVVFGAGVALMQLDRVRASNRFEDEHTRAFLEAAGFSPELARHLSNADSNGRSVGPVFLALAEHLEVEPRAFFQAMRDLSPSDLLAVVEAAHGVDPNDQGEFPVESEFDQLVVTEGAFDSGPHTLNGLELFLRHRGIELPGV